METAQELQAKAQIYKTLSLAYSSPDNNALAESIVSLKSALGTLKLDLCRGEVAQIEGYLEKQVNGLELAIEYTRLFRGPVKAEVYPYESIYVDGEIMGPSTLEVVKRYAEAGLASADSFKDLPDHISAELEFLYSLCTLQHHFLEEGDLDEAQRLERLRRSFLQDHLARWAPAFAEGVVRNTTSPFYYSSATIIKQFLKTEGKSS